MPRSPRVIQLLPLLFLLIACGGDQPLAPGLAVLRVSLAMTGLDLDADGALASVDQASSVVVPADRAATINLQPGHHTITLSGLAANCLVFGNTTRDVEVSASGITEVTFVATCGAAAGVVEVTISTEGVDRDLDGYLVSVDNGPLQRVVDGAPSSFAPITAGAHSLLVRDLNANCAVVGDNPVTGIQVTAGTGVRDTVRVAIVVGCNPRNGQLQVITTTTGPADPDGYILSIGLPSLPSYRIAANDTLEVTSIPAGRYALTVDDVAGNCSFSGTRPTSLTIRGGDTVIVLVTLACVTPAVLRVSAPTAGSSPDPGYLVGVDGVRALPLVAGRVLSLDLVPGTHLISLVDVAPNCSVTGPNPATVTLTTAAPSDVTFPVTCTPSTRTGLDVIIETRGSNVDWSYVLFICDAPDFDCFIPTYSSQVPAQMTLQLDLAPGQYYPELYDLASNCSVRWTGTAQVFAGTVSVVRADVVCAPPAEFVASVTTAGEDQQSNFRLQVDGRDVASIGAGSRVTVVSSEGTRAIQLAGLKENCRVAGPNPATVILVAGVLTPVDFAVECEAFPTIGVAVSTTGTGLPSSYLIGVDPDWLGWGGYEYTSTVTANGAVSIHLSRSGSHEVWLAGQPANCVVNSPNPVTVDLPLGARADLAFAVSCR
jgi:hypothetical protein